MRCYWIFKLDIQRDKEPLKNLFGCSQVLRSFLLPFSVNTFQGTQQRCRFAVEPQPHPLPHIPSACYALLFLRLILPEEFNLLPRVPEHNFLKVHFMRLQFHFIGGPCTVNPICKSVICGHINMTKVPVCSPGPSLSHRYYRPADASLWSAAVPTRVRQGGCGG